MQLDDITVSKSIIERFSEKLLDSLKSDVAIVGGGPAGLTAAYYLARAGHKVVLFERKLAIGGGMWGGGIMFNEIVVQQEGKDILDEFGVATTQSKSDPGYYCADSVAAVSTLCSKAAAAGARIFNLVSAEDVMIIDDKVTGLVINWTSVEIARLHVDPITVAADYVIDATGHTTEVAKVIERKSGCRLKTETGGVLGEKPMWADAAERVIVENTREIFPNVFVAGMAANAVFGSPRMGPIFGGMLLSGKRVAEIISQKLGE